MCGKLNMGNLPATVSTVPMAIGNLAWATTHVGDTCKQNEKWSLQPSKCSFWTCYGNYDMAGTVWLSDTSELGAPGNKNEFCQNKQNTHRKLDFVLTGCIQAKCCQINQAHPICRHGAFKGNPAYGTNFDGLSVKSLLCSYRAGGWRVKALHLCCYPFLDNCVGGGSQLKAYIYPLWCNCIVYSLIA